MTPAQSSPAWQPKLLALGDTLSDPKVVHEVSRGVNLICGFLSNHIETKIWQAPAEVPTAAADLLDRLQHFHEDFKENMHHDSHVIPLLN